MAMEMPEVFRWEDPPPMRRPSMGVDYDHLADILRANPGRWAVVREGTRARTVGHMSEIKSGKIAAFRPAGTFESTCRSEGAKVTVYARYVGESS